MQNETCCCLLLKQVNDSHQFKPKNLFTGNHICSTNVAQSLQHEHARKITCITYQNSIKNWQISPISLEISYVIFKGFDVIS